MANSKSQLGILLVLGMVAAGIFALLLTHRPPVPAPGPSADSSSTPGVPSPQVQGKAGRHPVDIDVFVDGSGSMKHFLQSPSVQKHPNDSGEAGDASANYLKSFLVKCEATLENAPGGEQWTTKSPRFFTFGAHVIPLQGESALRRLSEHPEGFNASRTEIEEPVRNPARTATSADKPAELKIIVTDLYENGGEMERPADALADEYLKHDGSPGAVGILAVRNPFVGGVEDLPGTPVGQTLPNAADSMPFYIIMAGPADDVRHCMEVCLQGTGIEHALSDGRALKLFFSRKPDAQAITPPDIKPETYNKVDDNYAGSGIEMIALSHGAVEATWRQQPEQPTGAAGHQPVFGTGFELHPAVQLVQPDGTLVDDPSAASATGPCDHPELLCGKIDRTPLKKGSTYLFRFDFVATRPSTVLEPGPNKLLSDWNIEEADAEQISRGPKQFPQDRRIGGRPGKTPDLSLFLTALEDQMFHSPVPVASYYLYVQAS